MKMSELFFGVLKILEKSSADGALSDQAASLLRRLTDFVEGGSFTKSKTDQFILENFRLSSAEMTGKWNALHPDRKKLDSTFRGQVSVLNNCSKVITEKSRPQGTALIIPPAQAAI